MSEEDHLPDAPPLLTRRDCFLVAGATLLGGFTVVQAFRVRDAMRARLETSEPEDPRVAEIRSIYDRSRVIEELMINADDRTRQALLEEMDGLAAQLEPYRRADAPPLPQHGQHLIHGILQAQERIASQRAMH